MNDQFFHNELDNAFKKGIESMELDPSPKAWKKVEAGISNMENVVMKKKIRNLKIISGLLGTLVISLSAFLIYHYSEHQLNAESLSKKEITETIAPVESDVKNIDQHSSPENSNNSIQKNEASSKISSQNIEKKILHQENTSLVKKNLRSIHKNSIAKQNDEPIEHNYPSTPINKVEPKSIQPNQPILTNEKDNANQNILSDKNSISGSNNEKDPTTSVDPVIKSKEENNLASIKDTTSKNNSPLIDTTKTIDGGDNFGGPVPTPSRFFLSAFFSPEKNGQFLKDNNTNDQITANDIRQLETPKFSFSTGLKYGFDLSDHWSIRSGFIYSKYAVNLKPTFCVSDDPSGNNHNSYIVTTSAGSIEMPTSNAGDSLTLKENSYQSFSYLDVPFQFAYSIKIKRFTLSAYTGVTAKILLSQTTFLSTESDGEGESEKTFDNIQGLRKTGLGYSFGLGLGYTIWKGLSLNLDPEFKGNFTPLNGASPIRSYVFGFGLLTGIAYHF